jgi:3-isopropylmalate dehydratase small subunit
MGHGTSLLDGPLRGRVWRVGDSIDTQQIAGGDGREVLRGVRPDFAAGVRPGDILVAGHNFGCGSHRQGAVEALQACGLNAVLAESVARLHLRNSIAVALPTFRIPGITDLAADGDLLEIDYPAGIVRNLGSGRSLPLARLPPGVERILAAGGLLALLAARLADAGIRP